MILSEFKRDIMIKVASIDRKVDLIDYLIYDAKPRQAGEDAAYDDAPLVNYLEYLTNDLVSIRNKLSDILEYFLGSSKEACEEECAPDSKYDNDFVNVDFNLDKILTESIMLSKCLSNKIDLGASANSEGDSLIERLIIVEEKLSTIESVLAVTLKEVFGVEEGIEKEKPKEKLPTLNKNTSIRK